MANCIERADADAANADVKRFRYDDANRRSFLRDLDASWAIVTQLCNVLDISVLATSLDGHRAELAGAMLDPSDAILVQCLRASGYDGVITDDRDFATVDGITVFTANATVISDASAQGKLSRRF